LQAENQYKGRVCGYVGFSSEMEHAIIAGAVKPETRSPKPETRNPILKTRNPVL
jgi:hypothetical protein